MNIKEKGRNATPQLVQIVRTRSEMRSVPEEGGGLPQQVKVVVEEREFVMDIACGANHSAAITAQGRGTAAPPTEAWTRVTVSQKSFKGTNSRLSIYVGIQPR
jgi:hypothetical protein